MAGPDSRLIIDFFNREASQIGITQESLNNSQPDQLIQAYSFLCDLIFENIGTSSDFEIAGDLAKIPRARPKMIIKTQQQVNMVFNKLFDGSDEFLYTDLLQPDPRRTKSLMAQLIRLYNTKCDLAKELSMVDNHIDDQMRAHDFEKGCERSTNTKLHDCEEMLTRMESRNEDLASKEWRLKEKLDVKKEQKIDEKKNIARIETLLEEAQHINTQHKQAVAQEDENRKRLENNMVNSPDRLIDELKHMEAEVENIRQKYDQAVQTCRRLEREFGEQRVTSQCLESMTSEMRNLEMLQDQMVEMRAKDEERRKKMDDLERERKELLAEIDSLEKQSTTDLEALKAEVNQTAKSHSVLQQRKAHLESDEKELAKRLVKIKEDIRQHQVDIKRKDRSFFVITDTYDAAVAKMLKNLAIVEQKVEQNRNKLEQVLDEKVLQIFDLTMSK